jgi:hypothetical protein
MGAAGIRAVRNKLPNKAETAAEIINVSLEDVQRSRIERRAHWKVCVSSQTMAFTATRVANSRRRFLDSFRGNLPQGTISALVNLLKSQCGV